jgi:hypothetical protein
MEASLTPESVKADCEEEVNQLTDDGLRKINFEKLSLKNNVGTSTAKSTPIESKEQEALFFDSSVPDQRLGLGFDTSLFSIPASANKNIETDLFGSNTISNTSAESGIFVSNTQPQANQKFDLLDVSLSNDEKINGGNVSITSGSGIRLKATDIDKVDDLTVGRLMEREELDFALFGKSKIQAFGTQVKAAPLSSIKKEIFDIEEVDDLNELEKATDSLPSNVTKSIYSFDFNAMDSTFNSTSEVDIANLDLNAYIAQQESDNGGGLFS